MGSRKRESVLATLSNFCYFFVRQSATSAADCTMDVPKRETFLSYLTGEGGSYAKVCVRRSFLA